MPSFKIHFRDTPVWVDYSYSPGLYATRNHEAEPAEVSFELLGLNSKKVLGWEMAYDEYCSIVEQCEEHWEKEGRYWE